MKIPTENDAMNSVQPRATATNAWMLRPTPHGIDRAKEFLNGSFSDLGNGLLAVGWPNIGNLDNAQSRIAIKERILTHNCFEHREHLGTAGSK